MCLDPLYALRNCATYCPPGIHSETLKKMQETPQNKTVTWGSLEWTVSYKGSNQPISTLVPPIVTRFTRHPQVKNDILNCAYIIFSKNKDWGSIDLDIDYCPD